MTGAEPDATETDLAPETDASAADPAPAADPQTPPAPEPPTTKPGDVPEGHTEVAHDDPAATLVTSGFTYAADEAGRFFVRLEHVALALSHGFRALAHAAHLV